MKVCLIFPPFPFSGRVPMVPPILEYLGALTKKAMPDTERELIDANMNEPHPEDIEADLIGISSMTATVTWAYEFSDKLRALGKKVVLGAYILPHFLKRQSIMTILSWSERPSLYGLMCWGMQRSER